MPTTNYNADLPRTGTFARSPNSKVVVIGSSKNGLPLILGEK